ncbi:hypothetical protein C2E23DRAFT_822458 [Lenzites betulinus]|nr:hypothetical protein C2E23DRAFT_822458 [Lenzites betulinus]
MSASTNGTGEIEQIRRLSQDIFAAMDAERPVLRLLDPATNELCDYRLMKISPRPPRAVSSRSSRPSIGASNIHPSLPQSPMVYGDTPNIWNGPPSFQARITPQRDNTPSLLDDSCSTNDSLRSSGPTPARRLIPRASRLTPGLDTPTGQSWAPNTSGFRANVGLGFPDLLKGDGTPFDGLGSLSRRTSAAQYRDMSPVIRVPQGAFPSTIDRGCLYLPQIQHHHPADRSGVVSASSAGVGEVHSSLATPEPARHMISAEESQSIPLRPEDDDIFLSLPIRVPGSLTRGLFRRPSSLSGDKGVPRQTATSSPLSVAPRPSWSLPADEKGREADGKGGSRHNWKP